MIAHFLSVLAAAAASEDGALFSEIGERALPGVTTTCGTVEKDWIVEVNGGGLVVEDFDRDGILDLVVVDGSTIERVAAGSEGFAPRLFLGRGDGSFAPAGERWRMNGGRFGMGGCAGDVNGDSFVDLLVTQWGPPRLFLNEGGAGFAEVPSERSGLGGERWGTSATFLDYDTDGALDLVVVNYLAFDPATVPRRGSGCNWKGHEVMCGPEGLVPVHDQLFRGRGDGTFEDRSVAAGFRPSSAGYGLGVITLDYDRDGDTDVYVANDSTPNHLWENQGDGTFLEVGFRRGVSHDGNGKEQAGMGLAAGDFDGDGREDLFVTNFSGENNALYQSAGALGFRERAGKAGLFGPSLRALGWGTGACDLDLDRDTDLFVFNGHVYPQAALPGTDTAYEQADQWFERREGEGGSGFVEHPLSASAPTVSRAGLAADLDRDGDLDLLALDLATATRPGIVRVLRNETIERAGASPPRGLTVRLRQQHGNTAAIGARIELVLLVGDERRTLTREIRSAVGFQASGPLAAHFGLGREARVVELLVTWPDGVRQTFAPPAEFGTWLELQRADAEEER